MSDEAPEQPSLMRDLVTLAKPGITSMNVLMTAGGYGLAPSGPGRATFLWALLGTTMVIAGANALNMWWERDSDRLMNRTADRPLPSGRVPAWAAMTFGISLGLGAVAIMWHFVNPLTALCGLFGYLSYVCIYTPLKRRTTLALVVGAVPGAMPPLMGWTAATGEIGAPAVVLFLVLLIWQIPHFIAISIYRRVDYEKAGIQVVPAVRGVEYAKVNALIWCMFLVPTSLLLVPMGVAGMVYFVVASAVGTWYFIWNLLGFEPQSGNRWARKFFFASLVYLPVLTLGLIIDVTFF